MYDFVQVVKQAGKALLVSFSGAWGSVAAMSEVLKADVSVGKQAVFAAGAAAIASLVSLVGNLIAQWREKAAGYLNASNPEAVVMLSEAQALTGDAIRLLK